MGSARFQRPHTVKAVRGIVDPKQDMKIALDESLPMFLREAAFERAMAQKWVSAIADSNGGIRLIDLSPRDQDIIRRIMRVDCEEAPPSVQD